MTAVSSALENALVNQKNDILETLNSAEDVGDLVKVLTTLKFCEDVWTACGYGYKIAEVINRIVLMANKLAADARELAAWEKWQRRHVAGRKLLERADKLEEFASAVSNGWQE